MTKPSDKSHHNAHISYRPDIDGLRAIAVLGVLLYHAKPSFLRGGYMGVDVFYVISGFLISTIIFKSLAKDSFSFADFWAKRVRRIFPALSLVLAFCLIVGWFAFTPTEYAFLGKHVLGGAGFVSNILSWQDAGYFDVESDLKPLLHLWSLGIEEQFYLFWPLFAYTAYKFKVKPVWIAVILFAVSFTLNLFLVSSDPTGTFFLLHTRLWELMAGVILAYMTLHSPHFLTSASKKYLKLNLDRHEASIAHIKSLLGLGMFVVAYSISNSHPFPGWRALYPVVGAMLIISAGPKGFINKYLLSSKPMVWIGLISYPLYIWHWPLMAFVRVTDAPAPEWAAWTALAVSFVLAWLTYKFVETPIRHAKSPTQRKVITGGLIAAQVALAGAGFYVMKSEGLPNRPTLSNDKMMLTKQLGPEQTLAFESYSGDICKNRYGQNWDVCRTNAMNKEPEIVMIGDSHSQSLYPGLSKLLTANNKSLLSIGFTGCPPVPGLMNTIRDDCNKFMDKAYDVAVMPSVKDVILFSRGPFYLFGEFRHVDEVTHTAKVKNVKYPGLAPDLAYANALEAALTRLAAAKKQVIFVFDVPELGFDVKECLDFRPMRLLPGANVKRKDCTISKAEYNARNMHFQWMVKNVVAKFPNVKIFDAASVLCDEQQCHGTINGVPMYYDSNHISVVGSEVISKALINATQLEGLQIN